MIAQDELVAKLLELYGDDYLQALCEHYPIQFQHIIKITVYYLSHAS